MVIIAALAFKLGSGSATSANRASMTRTLTGANGDSAAGS